MQLKKLGMRRAVLAQSISLRKQRSTFKQGTVMLTAAINGDLQPTSCYPQVKLQSQTKQQKSTKAVFDFSHFHFYFHNTASISSQTPAMILSWKGTYRTVRDAKAGALNFASVPASVMVNVDPKLDRASMS